MQDTSTNWTLSGDTIIYGSKKMMNKELFKPKVMYFGLCNSSGTFQQIINNIFQELLHEEVLANYMDDFVIPAKTKKKLEDNRKIQSLL